MNRDRPAAVTETRRPRGASSKAADAESPGHGPFGSPAGLGSVRLLLVGESPVGEDLGIVGLQADGLIVVPDGLVESAFISMDITPVAEGSGEIGFQADGLVVVLEGPVELAFVIIGIAPVVEGFCKIGFQADGLIVVGDGLVQQAFALVGKSPAGEGLGEIFPGEPPRSNVPGTGNDSDVGMGVTGVTPSNFLREIRLGGLWPCHQEEDGEGCVSDHIPPFAGAFRHAGWTNLTAVAAVAQPVGCGGGATAVLADRQNDHNQVRQPSPAKHGLG